MFRFEKVRIVYFIVGEARRNGGVEERHVDEFEQSDWTTDKVLDSPNATMAMLQCGCPLKVRFPAKLPDWSGLSYL